MLIVGSLTALVPFLGVQVTRCLRNYLLNLFEKCPMTVIAGDCDAHGLNLLGSLQETVGGE